MPKGSREKQRLTVCTVQRTVSLQTLGLLTVLEGETGISATGTGAGRRNGKRLLLFAKPQNKRPLPPALKALSEDWHMRGCQRTRI